MKLSFSPMIKPAGSACNMRCDYCYYLGTDYGPGRMPARMDEARLTAVIRAVIGASKGPVVPFTWHGGEPALMGLPFFQKAVELQKKYLPEGWEAWNNLQTNGTLLTEDFCAFLAENRFDVGVSLDGTPALHDAHRRFADGSPSWEAVEEAVKRLQAAGIQPDLLCTVNADTAAHGREVYRHLRDLGTGWVQFLPVTDRGARSAPADVPAGPAGKAAPDVVSPSAGGAPADVPTPAAVDGPAYGRFLKEVFAEWFFHDLGRTNVQLFAETAKMLAGGEPALCILTKTCGLTPVIEADGRVYACDHFVDEGHCRGQIRLPAVPTAAPDDPRDETVSDTADTGPSLASLLTSPEQTAFGAAKADLPPECQTCPWETLCHGGCPKDRYRLASDGSRRLNVLCEGFRMYFAYAVPKLKNAMALSRRGVSSEIIMKQLAEAERRAFSRIGRNDPCPCGSGRKAKACCGYLVP